MLCKHNQANGANPDGRDFRRLGMQWWNLTVYGKDDEGANKRIRLWDAGGEDNTRLRGSPILLCLRLIAVR
jgi:hypothetical protein